jgi:site-specific DNA-adenine methylase
MTTYQGGKKRIGKRIHQVIDIIEENLYPDDDKLPYFEPFIGMGGVMRHFGKENDRKLYACDYNKDIVLMWQSLQKDWKPPKKCTKSKYEKLKNSKIHSAERAFIGTVASWGGIFFHAYRLDYNKDKDFVGEGYRGLMDIKPDMKNVKFLDSRSYDTFKPKGFLIYCDPPYDGNALGNKNSLFQQFDHEKFWDTMRKWSKNNLVIISESTAPKDFKKIWSANSTVKIQNGVKNYQDNLYVYKDAYDKIDKKILKEIKEI